MQADFEDTSTEVPTWQPRILIVDDSTTFRELVRRLLEKAGFEELTEAGRVEEAMAKLEQAGGNNSNGFDLVLLDIDLPDLDGVEACRRIKADPRWQDLPVLMVTAHTESQNLSDALAAGAMDFLTKPLERLVFLARVRSALRLKRAIDERLERERQLIALTERLEEANENLIRLAEVDPLTELANRRKFDLVLDNEWRRCRRDGRPLALVLADIDRFKHYNDQYGHQLGDVCLQRVAVVLDRAARRPGDLACRWGGEEFTLILPGVDEYQCPMMAEYLRQQVENLRIEHVGGDPVPRVTISLGVAAIVPQASLRSTELVAAADRGLYRAKQEGRNRVAYEPVTSEPKC